MSQGSAIAGRVAIPRTVWALGFVSLFMDVSSELVHSLLPLWLVGSLGVGVLTLGIIEGIAEACAQIVKVCSGAISDALGRRKHLLLLGYGLSALSKPLFPLASTAQAVFLARFIDRVGKGLRGAPRDALIADVAPPEIRGACFGLRQSMDTVGAVLGPLAAIALMAACDQRITTVLWFAVLPAWIAVLLIVLGIDEEPRGQSASRAPIRLDSLRRFPARYVWVCAVGVVFTLARFSEAFLVLRARQSGLSLVWVPLVMAVMALFSSLSAYPAGKFSDRVPRAAMLAASLAVLIAADLLLAFAQGVGSLMSGVALWGLHMGLSQGVLAAMVADVTPPDLRGTAFGVFNLVCGIALLPASVLAGYLWQSLGAAATFEAGALFAAGALLLSGIAAWRHRDARRA
jgi:MFS family permease